MKLSRTIYFLIISFLLLALTSCKFCDETNSKENRRINLDNGMYISGDGKYRLVTGVDGYDSLLYIYSDDLIISGITEGNTLICVTEDVTTINLCNLEQDLGRIDIIISVEENRTVDLEFKGRNVVNSIKGSENLNVKGNCSTDELIVEEDIVCYSTIKITEGIIVAGYIEAWSDIYIIGAPEVYIRCNNDNEVTDKYVAGVSIERKLIVDLNPGGCLSILSFEGKPAVIAIDGISLANGTKLSKPEGGYVDISNYEFNDEYVVYNSDGTFAEEVVIKFEE